ncbi:hypothetical protein QN324_02325 [Streptococcus agalactiae]|uniref:hypothetical protein n=1 Tax=Streptococcus agalactiae TaxID=1311 RepID=UPI003F179C40
MVEIAERYNKNCVSNNPSLGSEKQSNSHFKNCTQSSYYGKYGLFDILLTDDDMTKIASLEKSEYLFGDVESLELIEYLSNNVFDI